MRTTRLRVRLRGAQPEVLRVLDVPAAALLPEVHELLQAGLGWTDSHLHQFVTEEPARYGVPDLDMDDEERDESAVRLSALPDRFVYLYDFGDDWTHDVEVLGPGGDRPGCVGGHGACPPEDCGGVHGYAELRAALSDPEHPEHSELRAWASGWVDAFDREMADLLVRQSAGMVPAPVRLLLDLTAGGVKLTPGGRLPRALVRDVQQQYPHWHLLGRPAAIEEDLPPLAALHDLGRDVGLLRLRKGVLSPTRAAGDDVQVIRRLRSWFAPGDGFTSVLVGVAVSVLATDGPRRPPELAARVYPLLGASWYTAGGQPLSEQMVRTALSPLTSVLRALDLIDTDHGAWSAGPSARTLLPRATNLAHLWTPRNESTNAAR